MVGVKRADDNAKLWPAREGSGRRGQLCIGLATIARPQDFSLLIWRLFVKIGCQINDLRITGRKYDAALNGGMRRDSYWRRRLRGRRDRCAVVVILTGRCVLSRMQRIGKSGGEQRDDQKRRCARHQPSETPAWWV